MFLAITILSGILACLSASPIPHGLLGFATAASTDTSATAAATETEETVPKIFSLDHGNVGVNFLGFKASAGLGGLLTGNSAGGGLHAEAGTPFGQAAHAGSSGTVLGEGGSAGGLYAGATAGGGVSAVAGLEGEAASSGSYSNTYSGASSGGVYKSKTKIKTYASPVSELESHKAYEQPAEMLRIAVAVFLMSMFSSQAHPASNDLLDKATVNDVAINTVSEEKKVEQTVQGAPVAPVSTIEISGITTGANAPTNHAVPPPPSVENTPFKPPRAGSMFARLIDDIFQIPITVLQSVAKLITNPFTQKKTPEVIATVS